MCVCACVYVYGHRTYLHHRVSNRSLADACMHASMQACGASRGSRWRRRRQRRRRQVRPTGHCHIPPVRSCCSDHQSCQSKVCYTSSVLTLCAKTTTEEDDDETNGGGGGGGAAAAAAAGGGEDVRGPHASLAVRLSGRDPGRRFLLGERLRYVLLAGARNQVGGTAVYGSVRRSALQGFYCGL